MKLRLRLAHAERARVKAQEQLAALHAENLRLRSQLRTPLSPTASHEDESSGPAAASTTRRIRPERTPDHASPEPDSQCSVAAGSPLELDDAARTLEGYRREVELLREALKERARREASFEDLQRKQREEHEATKQEWQVQLAGLVCEVQDLEGRNQALRISLQDARLATPSSVQSSTTASARGGVSEAISLASSQAGPSRSPSCCDDAPVLS